MTCKCENCDCTLGNDCGCISNGHCTCRKSHPDEPCDHTREIFQKSTESVDPRGVVPVASPKVFKNPYAHTSIDRANTIPIPQIPPPKIVRLDD